MQELTELAGGALLSSSPEEQTWGTLKDLLIELGVALYPSEVQGKSWRIVKKGIIGTHHQEFSELVRCVPSRTLRT